AWLLFLTYIRSYKFYNWQVYVCPVTPRPYFRPRGATCVASRGASAHQCPAGRAGRCPDPGARLAALAPERRPGARRRADRATAQQRRGRHMKQLDVQILHQSYLLTCPEGHEERLLEAVARVNDTM